MRGKSILWGISVILLSACSAASADDNSRVRKTFEFELSNALKTGTFKVREFGITEIEELTFQASQKHETAKVTAYNMTALVDLSDDAGFDCDNPVRTASTRWICKQVPAPNAPASPLELDGQLVFDSMYGGTVSMSLMDPNTWEAERRQLYLDLHQ